MNSERFGVIGLARARSDWFARVGHWASSGVLAVDFVKSLSAQEVRRRLQADSSISAVITEPGAPGFDRSLAAEIVSGGVALIVVADPTWNIDWAAVGVAEVLDPAFGSAALATSLANHVGPRRLRDLDVTLPPGVPAAAVTDADAQSQRTWMGALIAVTGGTGSGRSTVAMALAQGMAARSGNAGAVALADLSLRADLAMYHDVRDVVPGLQELVEMSSGPLPARREVKRHLFAIDNRGYSLLLGLRRQRDWTSLQPRALDAAIAALRSVYRITIADIDPEFDGESETGSSDVQMRNGPARAAATAASVVVVCGDAGLKGINDIVRVRRDLRDLGVEPGRLLTVVNRAPRSPRGRSEIVAALGALDDTVGVTASTTVFIPERGQLELVHSTAGQLPSALVAPVTSEVARALERQVDPQVSVR